MKNLQLYASSPYWENLSYECMSAKKVIRQFPNASLMLHIYKLPERYYHARFGCLET